MSKPHHAPGTRTHEAEGTSSADVSSRGEMTDQAKSEIKETFKPSKNYDAEMEAKFGKEPSEKDIVSRFASQEKFKGKNYQEILAQIEQDENKLMADRLRKKVKGESKSMTAEQEGKALAKAGYGDGEGGIKPLDEKAKKKIETVLEIQQTAPSKPETKKENQQGEKEKVEKIEKKEKVAKEPKEKKPWKVDINPFNRARHRGTRALSGAVGFPFLALAKLEATLARPQDVFYRKYRKDLGKNVIRTPKAILKSVTGAVYKPHRKETEFEDTFKGYGPTRGPNAKQLKTTKHAFRRISKPRKFIMNYFRSGDNLRHETIEGIKRSKWHRNPRKRNFKTFKYPKTREAFRRSVRWDHEPEVHAKGPKSMDNLEDIKKAA